MTDTKIIDGKAFSEKLIPQVAAGVEIFSKAIGQVPGLAGVLGGEDPASQVYVRSTLVGAARRHGATIGKI